MIRQISYLKSLAALLALVCVPASALTNLKQVQVSDGSQVDLLFDGKVSKSQIRTEFFNDVIQVVLNDVAVYPAKISSVSGGKLAKVFAYQYAPKLVRCRLTVKGKAEDYKDLVDINPSGKMVTIRIGGGAAIEAKSQPAPSEPAVTKSAAAEHELAKKPAEKAIEKAAEKSSQKSEDELAAEDKAILDRMIKTQAAPEQPAQKAAAAPIAATKTKAQAPLAQAAQGTPLSTIAGGKGGPNLLKAFGKMIFVFGLLGILLIGVKALKSARNRGSNVGVSTGATPVGGVVGKLKGFAARNFGQKGKLIEVIATHHLGPKRSIHVLRVAEKTLVVGVTNESINLISELDSEEGLLNEYGSSNDARAALSAIAPAPAAQSAQHERNAQRAPAHAPIQPQSMSAAEALLAQAGPSAFSDILGREAGDTGRTSSGLADSTRNRIKSRLEGYKQL